MEEEKKKKKKVPRVELNATVMYKHRNYTVKYFVPTEWRLACGVPCGAIERAVVASTWVKFGTDAPATCRRCVGDDCAPVVQVHPSRILVYSFAHAPECTPRSSRRARTRHIPTKMQMRSSLSPHRCALRAVCTSAQRLAL
eukprot:TRINITY_DN89_c1_g3_i2.p2 TRINITY_DN89_c1_g3~~TRINITY_DN89_c1_g3_i2.p2  ORF type:complete len:159 (-),score=31.88 TRINITY_DN89_c1_g3_i2:298-720(-)